MITVYISIGNSDDKLTQSDWSRYVDRVAASIHYVAKPAHGTVHGEWHSSTAAPWQNACWCVEISEDDGELLKLWLAKIAAHYRQDSIAWAVAETEFIIPGEVSAS